MAGRPHIVILMTDQQRGDCLSCAGHPCVRTPNMDRLAAEGIRFPDACTSSPVCMPARSSFLSGLYCHNHGQWGNTGCLPAGTDTFALRLREAGYRTCHVGKSHYYAHAGDDHLDNHKPYVDALGWTDVFETTGPFATQRTRSILTDRWETLGLWETFREDYRKRAEAGRAKATRPSPLPIEEHPDTFVGRTAVEYIESYDDDKPLLLFVGFGGPHYPWDAPKEWAGKYDPAAMDAALPPTEPPIWTTPEAAADQRALQDTANRIAPEDNGKCRSLYYGKISHLDHWFGRILDALQSAKMLDDTAVLFWSDHGEMLCDKGRFAKSVFYEGAVKVPFILRPPAALLPSAVEGRGEGGIVSDALVSTVDALPTILELAGCEPKASALGRSVVPLLANPEAAHRDAVFSEIRDRTMIFDGKYKMVVRSDGAMLKLYDLVEDPSESLNLAGKPETEELAGRLGEQILLWLLATQVRQPEFPPA